MFGVTTSDDYRPVAWMGRYPVDVTTMLVGLHVVCAVIACIFTAIPGLSGTLNYLIFDSARIWSGLQVWRLGTYAFVHSPSGLLWFAVEMYLLFVFGREVERFIGRRSYIALYLILLITPAVLLTIWGFWQPSRLAGSQALHFGIFVAFATIYPRAELFLRIIEPKPKYLVVPKMRPTSGSGRTEPDDVYASIDPILDKISKFGIGSLTASERRQLNRERERLLKKAE